jgi:hypothetical protein
VTSPVDGEVSVTRSPIADRNPQPAARALARLIELVGRSFN